ncbi:MAG: hypothetical protein ABJN34_09370 [Litoreibacter sp.]|uniref:hypothetical protein n=1 Tax=Litoreibacter sp. TaxID=1969459 RepID=UPI0032974D42
MSLVTRLREWINIPKNNKHQGIPKGLSYHIYRDIGLSEDEVDLLHHTFPSQSGDIPKF